jgi:hypothetical protein
MKLKVLLIGIILSSSLINLSNASAGDQPTTEVFTASQVDVDLNNPDLKINFEIIFTHSDGLGNISTTLILTNGGTNTISTPLIRTDNPINFSNTRVFYRGSITIPRTFMTGVYTYSVDGVMSNLSNGLRYSSGTISGPVLRSLKGAESGILVRNKGFLDLNYSTINGPTYESQSGKSYTNVAKYLSISEPIWKVGETINPNDYFESTVPSNELQVATTTPIICSVDGNLMKLISIGDCSFTISTPRTNEYLPKIIYQSKAITAPRKLQTLTIESIATQSAKNLPITLLLSQVYASGVSAVEYVIPKSITPEICDVAALMAAPFAPRREVLLLPLTPPTRAGAGHASLGSRLFFHFWLLGHALNFGQCFDALALITQAGGFFKLQRARCGEHVLFKFTQCFCFVEAT